MHLYPNVIPFTHPCQVQYMMGISQVTPTTYYYDGSSSFTEWIYSVAAMTSIPNVFSISYASVEWANSYLSMEQFNTGGCVYVNMYVLMYSRACLLICALLV